MSQAKLLNEKITKGQIDEALAAGATHAKFKNKGVQRRRQKEAQKAARNQERRDAHFKLVNKRTKQMREEKRKEEFTEAAKAPEVVETGVSALKGLFGSNLPESSAMPPDEHVQIHDDELREGLHTEHIAASSVPSEPHFTDYKFNVGGVEYVQGEAYFPALGKVVDLSKVAPPVAVSFDAESKGLVIRPEDMQTAIDQSVERVQDGHVFGASVATKFMDLDSHSEFEKVPQIDPLAFELKPYEPMNISALTNAGRYPLNLYGDESNYKPFPEIGEAVREDGLLMALPSSHNFDGVERPVDMVHDKLVYAEAGLSVGVEQVALVHTTLTEACQKAATDLRSQFLNVGALDPFATEVGGSRRQMFNIAERPDHKFDEILGVHEAIARGGVPAGQVAAVLGDAPPAPLVLHSTDGSKGVVIKVHPDTEPAPRQNHDGPVVGQDGQHPDEDSAKDETFALKP